MAQKNSPLPQYYGQDFHDGTITESPIPPRHEHGRASSDSRRELLRLPIQPHPAHLDYSMDPVSPVIPMDQSNSMGLATKTSNIRRIGGQADPNDWNASGRAYGEPEARHKPSQEFRTVPYRPATQRTAYVEDYSDEEEDPRAYRRRTTRQQRRPPAVYDNYYDQSSRYGPLASTSRSNLGNRPTYIETPKKPEYHMHYGSDDEFARPRPGMSGAGGGRGPPQHPPSSEDMMRLPWAIWMGSNAKNHFVAFIGEFVGTMMFLFFAFAGTQVANIGSSAAPKSNTTTGGATGFSPSVLLYISLAFGFSLMVNVWVFFRISGGLFNPAVTFAMLLSRALSPVRAFLLLAAQISGSIFASFLVSILFPANFNVRTTLSSGTSLVQGVFIEAILTAELVFTIFMLAKEKHKATFIAPVGIGLALFIAELVGIYYTGGSLNPARSFGPCVISGVWDQEHWIYWVGPAAGAIVAVVFYKFIKILEYEVANPGQDDDDKDQEIKETTEKGGADVENGYGTGVEHKAAGRWNGRTEGQSFGG